MKSRKKLISVVAVILILILSVFVYKTFQSNRYRNQLPEYPEFTSVAPELANQIYRTGRKAWFNPQAKNVGRLGMVYYSSAYYNNATTCFKIASEKDPSRWIWSYYLGHLDMDLGRSAEAVRSFRDVTEKDPDNIMAKYYLAESLRNMGSLSEAEEIFRKLSELKVGLPVTIRENWFPLKTYAKYNLARILVEKGLPDSAENILYTLIKDHVDFGPAYRLLGIVCNEKGNTLSGQKYTTMANDLVGYFPPADVFMDSITVISRSDIYLLKQIDDAVRSLNFKWALRLFDQALRYYPDNKHVLSKVLSGYLYLGKQDEAIPYLDSHLKHFSNDPEELMLFMNLLYNGGLKPYAMNYLDQLRKINPTDSRLALWLMDIGMVREGMSLINEQLAIEPENVTVLTSAVRMFSITGNREKAILYFDTLKKFQNSEPELIKLEAEIYENEGKINQAVSGYLAVLKSEPQNIFIIKRLIDIYTKNQVWDKLISHYRASLKYLPNDPSLLEGLGKTLVNCTDAELRNIKEGEEYLERAFINYKSSVAVKLSAGRILTEAYARSGDKEKASKYLNSSIDMIKKLNLNPEHAAVFEDLRQKYNIN